MIRCDHEAAKMRRNKHMVPPEGPSSAQTRIPLKWKTPRQSRNSRDDCVHRLSPRVRLNVDASRVPDARKMLGEIVGVIQSAENRGLPADYDCILRCLRAIFPALRNHSGDKGFADAAADYAVVAEMLFRKHPELDFREVMGELIELTSRLFSVRNMAWKSVYRHVLSISRALRTTRALNRLFAADIHQWIYAGIRDPFAYRARLAAMIDETRERSDEIDNSIHEERKALAQLEKRLSAKRDPKISIFEEKKRGRAISRLIRQHRAIQEEMQRKVQTLALLDSDIREFGARLREAGRTYLLHQV